MPVTKAGKEVTGVERDVLGRPRILAANEASRLWGDICCLQKPSAASDVRSGGARWGS